MSYKDNPEHRQRQLDRQAKRYAEDPIYRAKHIALAKEQSARRYAAYKARMASDPVFAAKQKARQKKYADERYANDPVFRQKGIDVATKRNRELARKAKAYDELMKQQNANIVTEDDGEPD